MMQDTQPIVVCVFSQGRQYALGFVLTGDPTKDWESVQALTACVKFTLLKEAGCVPKEEPTSLLADITLRSRK